MILQYIRQYARALGIVLLSVLIGAVALVGAYSLPTERMYHNAQKSILLYQWEGNYPSWAKGKKGAQLDNFTDSIMVRKAIFPGSGNVVRDAMLNPSYNFEKNGQVESLVKELKGETDGRYISHYARYWHGYLLFLKPLMIIGSIPNIRELNALLQLILTGYVLYLLGIQYGKRYSIAYFFAYLSLNPITLAISFQFSTMFYLATFCMLAVLKKREFLFKEKRSIFFFTLAGTMTAFFDFLTYPLVSFGFPMIAFLIAQDKNGCLKSKWDGIVKIIENGVAWAIGYAGMYIGKWTLSWFVTGYNTLQEASKQAVYRMSTSTTVHEGARSFSVDRAILYNLKIILLDPVFLVLFLALIVALVFLYRNRKKSVSQSKRYLCLAIGLVGLSPFAWYVVLSNHSVVHSWFTYRELSIFIFAVGCILAAKLDERDQDVG